MSEDLSTPPARKPWHRHFETVGSITAIVVGVAALYVSWDQGRVMREQVRASVWPALQLDGFVTNENGSLMVGVRVQNAGVGPALVERFTVRHNGELVEDFAALEARMPESSDRSRHDLAGRLMAAGDSMVPFSFRFPPDISGDAIAVLEQLSEAWSLEVCYCSTLGQCWEAEVDGAAPVEVRACDLEPGSEL